jgi:hypothetical protein
VCVCVCVCVCVIERDSGSNNNQFFFPFWTKPQRESSGFCFKLVWRPCQEHQSLPLRKNLAIIRSCFSSRTRWSREQFLLLTSHLIPFRYYVVFTVLCLHAQCILTDKVQTELWTASLRREIKEQKESNKWITITEIHSTAYSQLYH